MAANMPVVPVITPDDRVELTADHQQRHGQGCQPVERRRVEVRRRALPAQPHAAGLRGEGDPDHDGAGEGAELGANQQSV